MLRIDVPRKVSAQGRDAIGYALLSLFVAGLAVLVVLVVALRRMVLRPVSRLTKHAVSIAEGDDLTQRMNVRRADEIGVLAREFDRMVDKLADARRRLVDQSFEAGASQAASGVLHNIGNAMTPLSVTVATLQERLRSAPAGEIAMVLAEIESSKGDSARRADLEQFLRLASRELASVVASASDDVAVVARQAQAIHGALAQQLQSSRCGPVIETVELPPLVAQSVELVSPGLRQRITLDLDRSLYEAGPLPVPRVMLQQVFQNLIQNAAEAARGADGDRGHLEVSCVVEAARRRDTDTAVCRRRRRHSRRGPDQDLRERLLHEAARHQPRDRPALVRECYQRDRWSDPRGARDLGRRNPVCDRAPATVRCDGKGRLRLKVTSNARKQVRVLVVDDEQPVLDAYRQVLDTTAPGGDRAALDQLRTRLFMAGGDPALMGRMPAPHQPFEATTATGRKRP